MILTPYYPTTVKNSENILGEFFHERTIVIDDEITNETAVSVIAQIMYFASHGKDPIKIYINSYGGDAISAFAIYDCMQACPCVIETYNVGCAMSAAALLFAAGDRGHRFAFPHSTTMIHQVSSGTQGNAAEMRIAAAETERVNDLYVDILSRHTKTSKEKIYKMIVNDKFLNPEESKKIGIADRILEPLKRDVILSAWEKKNKKGK